MHKGSMHNSDSKNMHIIVCVNLIYKNYVLPHKQRLDIDNNLNLGGHYERTNSVPYEREGFFCKRG